MNGLRIAMVAPVIETGVATHLKEITPRLLDKGHKITVITTSKYARTLPASTKTYNSWVFPTKLYSFTPAALWDIRDGLRDYDLLHIHDYPHFLADYLTVTQPLHKKRLVLTPHGSLHIVTTWQNRCLKTVHNAFMLKFKSSINRFIAISEAEKKELIKRGISSSKIEVVYHGMSINGRETDKCKTGPQTIVYLGRLAKTKNLDLLIKALSYVLKQNYTPTLVLAGPDWGEKKRLGKIASDLGISNRVIFKAEMSGNEKNNLLDTGRIFVHPSLQDIFSLSVIEASAAGLPVVGFNIGANPEMIIDGKTGIIVQEPTPQELAKAILTLLTQPDLAEKMGRQGREYVTKKFSWDKCVEQLEKVYYEAVENRVH